MRARRGIPTRNVLVRGRRPARMNDGPACSVSPELVALPRPRLSGAGVEPEPICATSTTASCPRQQLSELTTPSCSGRVIDVPFKDVSRRRSATNRFRRERRDARLARGMCGDCGGSKPPSGTRCDACYRIHAVRHGHQRKRRCPNCHELGHYSKTCRARITT